MTQKLFLDDAYQSEFEAEVLAADETGIRLSQTLFYATSGGQPGDIGTLSIANQNLQIVTTSKGSDIDDIVHIPEEGCALPMVGDKVTGTIDWETRHKHMRMHTCLHLVCAMADASAQITGCQIGAEKSRIDLNLDNESCDKERMTAELNELIAADHPISSRWITDAELEANPDLVRSMSVRPPMGHGKVRLVQIGSDDNVIDLQPCGGTHVRSTAEVGPVLIKKIENKGRQNRRLHIIFESDA